MTTEPKPRRTDSRHQVRLGTRVRFLARVLGLTGALAVPVGYVLAADALPPVGQWSVAALRPVAEGAAGPAAQAGVVAVAAGAAAVLLALLAELFGVLFLMAGRKTAVGTNAAVQTALAAALLVVVNLISFGNYALFDLTRGKQFTLAPELVGELKTLRADSPTTVVVLQLHKTAGTLSDKPDAYDYAAERKVVEKVTDLVDQLREFGPRFNVAVLDVEDEGYERAVRDLTRTRPGLADAIAAAPENSIFFYADGKVRRVPRAEADRLTGPVRPATAADPDDPARALAYPGSITRLSFTEFYQLDKTASKEAAPAERGNTAAVAGGGAFAPAARGQGNLVLLPRGKEAFVRKVLALEERRPRVGLAVIHPLLTSRENYEEYTAGGLRRALEANGFEVVDVILKRWTRGGPPAPTAYTYEESELDRVEARYNLLNLLTADRELLLKQLGQVRVRVDKAPLPELDRMFARQLGRRITTETDRENLRRVFDANVRLRRDEIAEFAKQLATVAPQYKELFADERAVENRRVTDVRAKLKQYVDDLDLLIVPRLTVVDIARGDVIPPQLFNLAKDQAEVVKEFVKAGKPVLVAAGPTNVDRRGGPGETGGDDVEKLLLQLGIELGRQTLLTPAEAEAMAERQGEAFGSSVDLPPLVFDPPPGGPGDAADAAGKGANPIAAAFRVTARAVDRKLEVKKGGYRPVYVAAGAARRLPFAAEIMFSPPDAWNEDRPIPEDEYVPKFEPPKPGDPKEGTRDEERKGSFPVGVAVETPVPVDWYDGPELPAGMVPAAAVGGVAGAQPHDPAGFGPLMGVAGLALPFDRGLTAAGLTVAAGRVKRPTVRVVAFGHGGLFTGKRLDPANETLLLHTVNWELKRDDRLPRDVPDADKWRFPRADLTPRAARVWSLAAAFGLPALTVYLGVIALMVRRVR